MTGQIVTGLDLVGQPGRPAAADLLGCADEPIRVPGAVQPHGALLAVREPSLEVAVASENAAGLLGREVTGAALDDLLDADAAATLRAGLGRDLAELNPLRVAVGGRGFDLVAHRAGGLLVTEWEPVADAQEAGAAWHRRLPLTLQRLQAASTLEELSATLAAEVRGLTGFDRVMVYRFDEAWNGEVVAEDRRADLEPFLGLRYPASDIPAQARALYLVNWLRLIPDARYTAVPLVPERNPLDGAPLDLTGAQLRSVSPVHLEYLSNMGVVASMSVSLIDSVSPGGGGRLWGLIACHHYAGAHRPSYVDRVTAEFLGRTASVLLGTRTEAGAADEVLAVAETQSRLVEAMARSPRAPLDALTAGEPSLLDLLPAGGAAARIGGRLHLLGTTPPADRVGALLDALLPNGATTPVATDALSRQLPETADVVDTASGVLAVPVGGGRSGDALAWFRPETLREVHWGGDPTTPKVVEGERGPRLSPRRSFARWSETVRATSAPWRPHETTAAAQLAGHLTEVTRRLAEQEGRLAATLQRTLLLEQLPVVPGVALAARYTPSASDVVGGDWYDLVLLPSGRVCVVLGDVAGHGLGAAAITAQLRHALRAYLLQDAGPAAALRRLNELVHVLLPEETATAIVAELEPSTGALTVANAGHPPVLLRSGGSGRYVDEGRGPALGLLASARYGSAALQLSGDDRLVVYSDGLVEVRGEDLQDGLDRLRTAAEASGADADDLLDALLSTLAPTTGDDVTVLAVGLADGTTSRS